MLSGIKDSIQVMLCPNINHWLVSPFTRPVGIITALIFKWGGKSTLELMTKIKLSKYKANAHNCMELKNKMAFLIKGFLYEYSYY